MVHTVKFSLVALTVTLGALVAGDGAAVADTDVSINAAAYSYSAWDSLGGAISPAPPFVSQGGDQVGLDYPAWANYDAGVWTATTTFVGSTSSVLTITDLQADDRVVLELNGVPVASAGIENYGSNFGSMVFTPGAASVAWTFVENAVISSLNPVIVSSGFLNGTNTLTLILNNTFNGINDCDGPTPTCGGNPTLLQFAGSVTSGAGVVPEASTWAMLGIGFAGLGLVGHRARRRAAVVAR